MGCGKSSVGRELAVRRGARFVDLDEEIVAREGRSVPDIFREGGEAAFRAAELRASILGKEEELRGMKDIFVPAENGGSESAPAADSFEDIVNATESEGRGE